MRKPLTFVLAVLFTVVSGSSGATAFSIVLMARRGKGDLRRTLEGGTKNMNPEDPRFMNEGKGQEITGVSIPTADTIKGWEFGAGVRVACANVDNNLYAIQGNCPRCAFDLWRGDLLTDRDVWANAPCIACPTCSTTYGLRNGAHGPPLKRSGLAGFVAGLAATSTNAEAFKDAKAFRITLDPDGRIYCRDA